MRKLHHASFAVTSDGALLLNIGEFTDHLSAEEALRRALAERGPVFIGVQLSPAERRRACLELTDNFTEVAAFLVGARLRAQRERRAPKPRRSSSGGT